MYVRVCCVQERAPTSVAYAENQSMFLDSLSGDGAWLGRYAVSREGQVMPWKVVKQLIQDTHPYEVFQVGLAQAQGKCLLGCPALGQFHRCGCCGVLLWHNATTCCLLMLSLPAFFLPEDKGPITPPWPENTNAEGCGPCLLS